MNTSILGNLHLEDETELSLFINHRVSVIRYRLRSTQDDKGGASAVHLQHNAVDVERLLNASAQRDAVHER